MRLKILQLVSPPSTVGFFVKVATGMVVTGTGKSHHAGSVKPRSLSLQCGCCHLFKRYSGKWALDLPRGCLAIICHWKLDSWSQQPMQWVNINRGCFAWSGNVWVELLPGDHTGCHFIQSISVFLYTSLNLHSCWNLPLVLPVWEVEWTWRIKRKAFLWGGVESRTFTSYSSYIPSEKHFVP